MKRKITSLALRATLIALGFQADAQQPKKVARIGYISQLSPSNDSAREAFRQGLRELGYIENQNIVVEWRFTEGENERLPELAEDLVHGNVDIIVTSGGTEATMAAKRASKTIPIVMTSGSDPVGTGLIASLARPGEM